ncbi:MAG: prepilin-type N-terminal cleavage/methylation domain-containing protein [Phycisphaerales bacterium]|nr:prepilin-type N-terminal cleavage/methylation domain-containing protein [Phycisphaerales bacterium]
MVQKYTASLNRSAFTLIEVVTSLSILSVLMIGLSSAVLIGSHAIPTTTDAGLNDQAVIDTINQLRSDLREASSIERQSLSGGREVILVTIKDSGAKGVPGVVNYVFNPSTNRINRTVDAGTTIVMVDGLGTFVISITMDGVDASVLTMMITVENTIQGIFEMHALLPDKPGVI